MSGGWIAYRKAKKEIEILKMRIESLEKQVEESHSHREEAIE
jgi:hypothetical protein|tara:strand:- start:437 stop:562 length:126 start_codon:yes stop_codon:yes gene_type:complete